MMREILSLALPALVSVTFFGELVLPTCSVPKFKAVGSTFGVGVLRNRKATGVLVVVIWPGIPRSLTPSELKSPATKLNAPYPLEETSYSSGGPNVPSPLPGVIRAKELQHPTFPAKSSLPSPLKSDAIKCP